MRCVIGDVLLPGTGKNLPSMSVQFISIRCNIYVGDTIKWYAPPFTSMLIICVCICIVHEHKHACCCCFLFFGICVTEDILYGMTMIYFRLTHLLFFLSSRYFTIKPAQLLKGIISHVIHCCKQLCRRAYENQSLVINHRFLIQAFIVDNSPTVNHDH